MANDKLPQQIKGKKVKIAADLVDPWIATLRSAATALYNVGQDALMSDLHKIMDGLEGAKKFKEPEPEVDPSKGDLKLPDVEDNE